MAGRSRQDRDRRDLLGVCVRRAIFAVEAKRAVFAWGRQHGQWRVGAAWHSRAHGAGTAWTRAGSVEGSANMARAFATLQGVSLARCNEGGQGIAAEREE